MTKIYLYIMIAFTILTIIWCIITSKFSVNYMTFSQLKNYYKDKPDIFKLRLNIVLTVILQLIITSGFLPLFYSMLTDKNTSGLIIIFLILLYVVVTIMLVLYSFLFKESLKIQEKKLIQVSNKNSAASTTNNTGLSSKVSATTNNNNPQSNSSISVNVDINTADNKNKE